MSSTFKDLMTRLIAIAERVKASEDCEQTKRLLQQSKELLNEAYESLEKSLGLEDVQQHEARRDPSPNSVETGIKLELLAANAKKRLQACQEASYSLCVRWLCNRLPSQDVGGVIGGSVGMSGLAVLAALHFLTLTGDHSEF